MAKAGNLPRTPDWLSVFLKKVRWRVTSVSVRTKIMGIVLMLVLIPGVMVTVQVRKALTSTFREELREQSISIARDLAARSTDLILINDLYGVSELLRKTQINNPDVRYAFIVDPEGNVIAHTFGKGFPPELLPANSVKPTEHHHTVMLNTDEGPIWDTAVPIFDGKAGFARVGISESRMKASLREITTRLMLFTGLIAVIGIIAGTFLTWVLTRPLLDLAKVTEALRAGDFSRRVEPWADDEIGELAEAFNAMAVDLAKAEADRNRREEMRKTYLQRIISAQEEERKRIARELHDETGQALASLVVGLRNVESAPNREEMLLRLSEMRSLISSTLEAVHNLALELRPSVLDDLGLRAALQRYSDEYQNRYDVNVDFQSIGLGENRLSPLIETAVYRIVQEALTNAAKHAHATQISVLVEKSKGQLSVIVEDNGVGFDVEGMMRGASTENHLGLYGMYERASQLGGSIVIESEPGKGTAVYVRIPLDGGTYGQNTYSAG